jgi:hypothetical protein
MHHLGCAAITISKTKEAKKKYYNSQVSFEVAIYILSN